MAQVLKLVAASPLGIPMKFYNPRRDGVTQSVLSKFKNCRELARLSLQGWTQKRNSLSQIFGTVVHAVLEFTYTDIQSGALGEIPTAAYLKKQIAKAEKLWRRDNPKADVDAKQALEVSCLLAEVVLPVYFRFWHKDLTAVNWKHLEHKFLLKRLGIPVRGKMDGSFVPAKDKKTWLFETKTKSRLGEQGESNLVDVLAFELQVNLYLGAIHDMEGKAPGGVLYNIIRRPNLQQKKGEALMAFRKRIEEDVRKRPAYYFIRLRMSVSASDLARERREHDAMVGDFLAWFDGKAGHYKNSDYCENKYGTCGMLAICARNDYSGFYKRPVVFKELEDLL